MSTFANLLFEKLNHPVIICGIMTGTSVDGIDTAIVQFETSNNNDSFKLIAFESFPIDSNIKILIQNAISNNANSQEISYLHHLLAHLYKNSFEKVCDIHQIDQNSVDAIAIHGQTIWHQTIPIEMRLDNGEILNVASTLQIGSGAALSALTKKIVISDFRCADIALGGQAAPLVPAFDRAFLQTQNNNQFVIALNIGGISNITVLAPSVENSSVLAYDTGPGNCMIDQYIQKHLGLECDFGGKIAYSGKIISPLIDKLKAIEYIHQNPPKSTGRELFNLNLLESLIQSILDSSREMSFEHNDVICTLSEFTAYSIAINISNHCKSAQIFASGGGIHNRYIMERLKFYLNDFEIIDTNSEIYKELIPNPDAKEAIAFAWLGYQTLQGKAGNISSVTGAKEEVALGSISMCF